MPDTANKTIWKFPLAVQDVGEIQAPQGACFLTVQVQGEKPYVWALVDQNAPQRPYRVLVWGTGHPHQAEELIGFRHLGTFQMHAGQFVFHAFVEE